MQAVTETVLPSPEEMFAQIQETKASKCRIEAKNVPVAGTVVLIGEYYSESHFQVTHVTKIDRRGVVHTSDGMRFSTKGQTIVSTQKIDGNYWFMFDLQKSYEAAVEKVRNNQIYKSRQRYWDLIDRVKQLEVVEDDALIEALLQILDEEGK